METISSRAAADRYEAMKKRVRALRLRLARHENALFAGGFCALVGAIYLFSNPQPIAVYNQTYVIAGAFLDGRLGVPDPRPWLELVPGVDQHYSVFPLGAVLCMLPFALAARIGLIQEFPAGAVTFLLAFGIAFYARRVARDYSLRPARQYALILFFMFGNWMWCNLIFGVAWQHALGFAVLGQLGIIDSLRRGKHLWAGVFYAIAFGNRVELLALAPLLIWLAYDSFQRDGARRAMRARDLLRLCAAPAALVAMTMAYNHARFGVVWETGHQRIPYVADQRGYRAGLMNLQTIPSNAYVMLIEPWQRVDRFPYFMPHQFGDSILWASPFLVLLLRRGARQRRLKRLAWGAVLLVTLILWSHGNPGGYQYSFRYAMEFLPWVFIILLESSFVRRSRAWLAIELALLTLSVAINAYAVYAYYWARYV